MPPKRRSGGNAQRKEAKATVDPPPPDEKDKTSELSAKKHEDKDAEFVGLCESLHVSDPVCDRAWALSKTVQESLDQVGDAQKKLWAACLYVAMTDMDAACFTFTQVLQAVGVNVKQFLALVRKLDVNLDTISTKVNSALTRQEKSYNTLLALCQRFEKICKKIFVSDGKEQATLRSCWTLFLLAKGRALQMEDDLVISFQLLLCTLELFIKRCPGSLLQPLYKSSISKVPSPPQQTSRRNQSKARTRPTEPVMDVQLLETLCKENECNAEEVKNIYQTSFSAFLGSLDLPKSLDVSQTAELNRQYEEHYLRSGDIDGRLFFDRDTSVMPPKVDVTQVERTPKKNLPEDESSLIPPQTPIKTAMTSIQQLRRDLSSSGEQPSAALLTYFNNCTVNPTQDVLKRVETLGRTFNQRFGQTVGPGFDTLGKQRFELGVTLYYTVMESLLKSEEQRLSVQNFSKLLNNATFHTSLLACSLEVVMAIYDESSFKSGGGGGGETGRCFPWILDVFGLAAFDFYKVIESFIKVHPNLNKDVVKHLETCENLIMERFAWTTGSPVFELLKQEHEGGAAEQVEAPANFSQPLNHNHTAADLYLSPVRSGVRILPPDSPARPASLPAPPAASQTPLQPKSNSLSLFYKKLYRLAYMRLKMLCSNLLPSHPELEPIIWTLFQHTLQHEFELMRDRHLDQLMMSAMYAICKVKAVDLRFKAIVTAYKNMPNACQETFKHVLISEGQYDSIIVFYNNVFMQKLKTNILQYASTRPPPLSPLPQITRSPYKFPNSPLRVPGSNNVYVSPMKSSRMSPGIMTPRSRMLVSIGESFGCSAFQTNRFQMINQMVNGSDRSSKRSLDLGTNPKHLKRLRFDVDGQDEADGSKSGGDSTLIQKLAEMSSARSCIQEQKLKEDADSRKE
ncbi:retinoblastoma-associated protein isoform X1 [Synchiropus splendidus]|uniref:retinoblastoma-associated protein isoform X1 n=1 Tax=Synchiropus splendidus TaxID=270530 RepID=UPI00237E7B40|nr:retinoblastoma-associated protein isoform X1 [Synchiropus splendidus]